MAGRCEGLRLGDHLGVSLDAATPSGVVQGGVLVMGLNAGKRLQSWNGSCMHWPNGNEVVDSGQWDRSYGNELWEFDELGYMKRRFASINDLPIKEADRKFRWERKAGVKSRQGGSQLGLAAR
jgi:hypothetical protein